MLQEQEVQLAADAIAIAAADAAEVAEVDATQTPKRRTKGRRAQGGDSAAKPKNGSEDRSTTHRQRSKIGSRVCCACITIGQ